MTLLEAFQGVEGPRLDRRKRHSLEDVLVIANVHSSVAQTNGQKWKNLG